MAEESHGRVRHYPRKMKSLDMIGVLGIYIPLYTVSKIHEGGGFYG